MSLLTRAEQALSTHFNLAAGVGAPPRLVAAMRHAVFSGGARIRPQLCMAVATACGDDAPQLTNAAAVALELMHCASLVHDDMPALTTPTPGAACPRCTRLSANRWRCWPVTD